MSRMERQSAMVLARPITVPELTLEQARCLQVWEEETRNTESGLLDFKAAVEKVHSRWGFLAYDAITKLREGMEPVLLGRWGLPDPMSDMMMLHPWLREHPELVYVALNESEARAQMLTVEEARAQGVEMTANPFEDRLQKKKGGTRQAAEQPTPAPQAAPVTEPSKATAAKAPMVAPAGKPAVVAQKVAPKGRVLVAPKGKAKSGLARAAKAAAATRGGKKQRGGFEA